MIQEYLIKDEGILNALQDFSSDKIKQEVSNVGSIHILSITISGENEESAKALSKIHEEIISTNEFIVLSNGSSEYFNKSLFPQINEFERRLRKLLYLAAVLSDNGKIGGIENIKDLEKKDLGDIFETLFTDREFNNKTRAIKVDISWQYSKKWLTQYIRSIDEVTLWGELLGNNIQDLSNHYIEVKDARNDVMHAHDLNYSGYLKIKERFKKINQEIDQLIVKLCTNDGDSFKQFEKFNIHLSEALKEQARMLSEVMKPLTEQMDEIKRAFTDLALSSIMDGMRKQLSQLSDLFNQLNQPNDDAQRDKDSRKNDDND